MAAKKIVWKTSDAAGSAAKRESSGWLAGIISKETAADREEKRRAKEAERARRQEDAAARRKLRLEKQAAKNRRYDAITQMRKERGGSGIVILYTDMAPAAKKKGGKKGRR